MNNFIKKAHLPTLIVSLILAAVLILSGAITLIIQGVAANGGNNVGSLAGDDVLYSGRSKTKNNAYSGSYYTFKFTPNSSGNYEICLNDASFYSINSISGSSVSYNYSYNSSYDYCYSAYLYSGTTYEIRVVANYSTFNILVNYSY